MNNLWIACGETTVPGQSATQAAAAVKVFERENGQWSNCLNMEEDLVMDKILKNRNARTHLLPNDIVVKQASNMAQNVDFFGPYKIWIL